MSLKIQKTSCVPRESRDSIINGTVLGRGTEMLSEKNSNHFFFFPVILTKKHMDLNGKHLRQRGKKMLRNLFVQNLLSNLNLKG